MMVTRTAAAKIVPQSFYHYINTTLVISRKILKGGVWSSHRIETRSGLELI